MERVFTLYLYHEICKLGFDLFYGRALLDMKKGTLNFDGEYFHLNIDQAGSETFVPRVTICKRSVIPPNSVNQIKYQVFMMYVFT